MGDLQKKEEEMRQMFVNKVKETAAELKATASEGRGGLLAGKEEEGGGVKEMSLRSYVGFSCYTYSTCLKFGHLLIQVCFLIY